MIDSLRLAQVVAIHPESHTVDLVFVDDGWRVPNVAVMAPAASTNTGLNDLPAPARPASDPWVLARTKDRDMIAVVGFAKQRPIVLGFLYPQVCQMLFPDPERMVYRHASDLYMTVDKDGNLEVSHPSGTFLRIGEAPEHEDLTGKDFDGRWAITKNTDKAPHVRLCVANAGAVKASLTVAPTGDVTLDTRGALTGTVDGETSLTTPKVTLDTAELLVTGKITAGGTITDMAGSGGKSMDAMRTTYNAHTHPENDNGGPTGAPNQSM